MDTESGRIYRELTDEQMRELEAQGRTIVPVSERVADAVEIGMEALNRAERRAAQYAKNQRRDPHGR
jgi:hypothetical protein